VSNTQLAIHISRTSVHVAEVLRSNQEIIQQHDFELLESTPDAYKDKLKSFFNSLTTLKDEYPEYTMAWSTPKQTLVPLSVYNESSSKSIFHLMFGESIDEKMIDFNRLMELSMVSVFEIPDWVKSFFIIKYPQIVFKHEHAMTLRALFQMGTFKRKITVSFNDDYVNITIIHKNELTFSNGFEYQTAEDVLYNLLFVLEQEGLTNEEGSLNFYFIDKKTENKAKQTIALIEQLKPFKSIKISTIDSILKLQTLCV
jgi:virulence-associated protein VapD